MARHHPPPPDPTDPIELAGDALSDLRRARDWDEATPVTHVNVNLQRLATPPPVAPPERSVHPRNSLDLAGLALKRSPGWGLVLLGLAALATYAYLATHGHAPTFR